MAVRTLDFSKFTTGSAKEKQQFCEDLINCFTSEGMAKIINHNLTSEEIDQAFHWNKRFFALPKDTKSKIAHPPRANPNRGWSALGQEKSSAITNFEKGETEREAQYFDAKEAFDMGSKDDPLYDNMWLDEAVLPGFKSFMEALYERCDELHTAILNAIEQGFRSRGIQVELLKRCQPSVSELRFNYYPPIDVSDIRSGKMNRISEHTDFGTVTLLLQDSVGGLEVEDQSNMGTYFPVEASSKAELLVNVGDSLQRLTNDVLTSVSHRVVIPVSHADKEAGVIRERYSIAYFAKVNRNESLKPLVQFVDDSHPMKYDDMTAYELNQVKLNKLYG